MALPRKLLIRILYHGHPITSILFLLIYCAVTAIIPSVRSLSTVSISKTSDRTTICALLYRRPDNLSSLNCTSFPPGLSISETPTTVPFSAVVAGDGFVCGLRSSSASVLNCWRFSSNGSDLDYKRIYRGPALLDLAGGNTHVCGLVNGTRAPECWQWPGFNPAGIQGIATNVAVGDDFVCGLSDRGEVLCSGNNSQIVQNSPNGSYSMIAAGSRHACAISKTGSLNCWGDAVDENPHPQGKFRFLALGENRSCAMRSNGTVVCWGQNNFSLPSGMRDSYFVHIEAKRSVFCGVLTSNYSLYCWDDDQQLDSNHLVFENVVPGPCRSSCRCGTLPLYSEFCSQGYICQPCEGEDPPIEPPLPPPPSPLPQGRPAVSKLDDRMVAFIVVGSAGSACLLLLFCFLLFKYCKGKVCRVHDSGRLDEASERPEQLDPSPDQPLRVAPPVLEKRLSHIVSMGIGNGGQLEEFSLQSLAEATNRFAPEFKIGSGSFGSVYRAKLEDGREVAIKRAEVSEASANGGVTKRQLEDKDHAFVNELEALSRLNHKNLVRLLGFCEDSNELILVYEYMINGTLHDHLHKLSSSPLMSWTARLKVALDAARGIEYLHAYSVPAVIHRDIKSSNILLDSNWTAKVSDFGLSLMGPEDDESHLSLHAAGTVGYVDPEYYRLQHLTLKSDIYSFGVVLLELLSGYRAIHKNENQVPRNVVDIVVPYIIHNQIHRVLDPKVPSPTPFEIEAVKYVGYLAADCVSLEGKDRPSSTEVVDALQRALVACSAQPTRSLSLSGNSHINPTVNLSFLNTFQKCKSF